MILQLQGLFRALASNSQAGVRPGPPVRCLITHVAPQIKGDQNGVAKEIAIPPNHAYLSPPAAGHYLFGRVVITLCRVGKSHKKISNCLRVCALTAPSLLCRFVPYPSQASACTTKTDDYSVITSPLFLRDTRISARHIAVPTTSQDNAKTPQEVISPITPRQVRWNMGI